MSGCRPIASDAAWRCRMSCGLPYGGSLSGCSQDKRMNMAEPHQCRCSDPVPHRRDLFVASTEIAQLKAQLAEADRLIRELHNEVNES